MDMVLRGGSEASSKGRIILLLVEHLFLHADIAGTNRPIKATFVGGIGCQDARESVLADPRFCQGDIGEGAAGKAGSCGVKNPNWVRADPILAPPLVGK
jgi:hypothetical protein